MSIVLSPFSVATFNNAVSDFHKVRHYGDKHQSLDDMGPTLEKFGDLFRKHGKTEYLALSLAHRHFELHNGERKVAKQVSENSTIEISAMSEQEATGAQPYLLLPMENDKGKVELAPLEYIFPTDDKHRRRLEQELAMACDEDFLKEFLALTLENQVAGVYGLMLRSRDTLQIKKLDEAYLEGPGGESRSLLVEIVAKEKYEERSDISKVAWVFEKEFGTKPKEANGCWGYWCCNVCVNH